MANCGEANGLRLCDIHNPDKILPTEGSSCILQGEKKMKVHNQIMVNKHVSVFHCCRCMRTTEMKMKGEGRKGIVSKKRKKMIGEKERRKMQCVCGVLFHLYHQCQGYFKDMTRVTWVYAERWATWKAIAMQMREVGAERPDRFKLIWRLYWC